MHCWNWALSLCLWREMNLAYEVGVIGWGMCMKEESWYVLTVVCIVAAG